MPGLLARVTRPLLPLVALAGLLAPVPRAGAAEPSVVGRRAPELHVYSAIGGPEPSIAGLRGRLVVLEFFRTTCPHCQAAVPHLNELQRSRFDRGLRVIGLSKDADESLRGFAATYSTGYPLARMDPELYEDYGVVAIPTAVLVSPEGLVLWSGKPGELTLVEIDRRLEATPPWPALPPALEGAARSVREGRFREARTALAACAASTGCGPAEAAVATTLLGWTDRYAERVLAAADADLARGDAYEAWRGYDAIAREFDEPSVSRRANAGASGILLGDAGKRRDVEAGRALDEARAAWRTSGRAAGQAALDAVAKDHAGTAAGARAAAIAAKLRKRAP